MRQAKSDGTNNQGNQARQKRILLALLPFWTPLIPPQGIARIKGFLKQYGYDVKTLDVNLETGIRKYYDIYFLTLQEYIPPPNHGNFYNIGNDVWRDHMMAHINHEDEKEYIELVKILIFKTFYTHINELQIRRLNSILEEFYTRLKSYFLEVLDREKPDVIGISVYRDTLASSLFVFRLTKKKYPNIQTVMGGGIFSSQLFQGSPDMDFFLKNTKDCIDKIVIGKGETFFLKFLEKKLPHHQRIFTWKDYDDESPTFPSIEMYDFSDFDSHHYTYQGIQGSVSCPNRCSFCNVASFYGDYKTKDPGKTVDEMIVLYKKYHTQLFFMLDAMVNDIASGIARELIKRELCLYWDGYLRVDGSIDLGTTQLWRRGGFYRARIGVESGSQKVLDLMTKGITVEQIKSTLTNLALAGIKTTAYIVIGHPGETEECFMQTLELMEEFKNDIWEAECNPFTYFYRGQSCNDEWAHRRVLLYPEPARKMLLNQTWILDDVPSREEMFDRIFRFTQHCKKLGINVPWSLHEVNKSDQRWKKKHKNAVPAVVELVDMNKYIDECRCVRQYLPAEENQEDEGDFGF